MNIAKADLFDRFGAAVTNLTVLAASHAHSSFEYQRLTAKAKAMDTAYNYAIDMLYNTHNDESLAKGYNQLRTFIWTDKVDADIALKAFKAPNETAAYAKALGTYEGVNLATDYVKEV